MFDLRLAKDRYLLDMSSWSRHSFLGTRNLNCRIRARQRRGVPVWRNGGDRPRRPAAHGAGAFPLPRPAAGRGPGRRNLTNPLIRALDGGSGLPRLDTSRLRATWLAEVAELLGLATFMAAAGISCSQRPGDLLAGLEPAGEAAAVRLPGAARRP
jgi:hypothetical protein